MRDDATYEGLEPADKKKIQKYINKVNKDYDEFLSTQLDSNPELAFTAARQSLGGAPGNKNKVIDELKKRGYNAMVDEAGVGSKGGIEGFDPLIIFNGADSLRSIKVSEIDNYTANAAGERTRKWRENTQNYVAKYKENW